MTTLLPSAVELAQIRTDYEKATMPDTCDILSLTRTGDSAGGWSEAWGTASGTIACRIDPLVGNEQLAGGGVQSFYTYILSLPHGTSITAANRVKINSVVYNVTDVDANKSWSSCVRATIERVLNG